MRLRPTRPLAAALFVLGLAATTGADEVVLIPDSTVRAPGGRLRGQIQAETPNEVRINNQAVPIDQIAEVTYDNQPQSFIQARVRQNAGNLAEAADLYRKAADEAGSNRRSIAQAARFERAKILSQIALGDPSKRDEAIKELEGVVTSLADTRHFGPALELKARLHLVQEQFDEAEQVLNRLSSLKWAADRAAVLKTKVRTGRGQFDGALSALDSILNSAPEGSATHREAQLARAEALAGLERFDEAEQAVRDVIANANPEDASTLAPAYNTLGDSLRAAGKPRDALFAYLHTDILYASEKDEHARALAEITRLWRALDRADRASQTLERLKQQYPQSPYLSAASGSR